MYVLSSSQTSPDSVPPDGKKIMHGRRERGDIDQRSDPSNYFRFFIISLHWIIQEVSFEISEKRYLWESFSQELTRVGLHMTWKRSETTDYKDQKWFFSAPTEGQAKNCMFISCISQWSMNPTVFEERGEMSLVLVVEIKDQLTPSSVHVHVIQGVMWVDSPIWIVLPFISQWPERSKINSQSSKTK